ncbi:MAG: sugar transferase [Fibrobacterota bacterium]
MIASRKKRALFLVSDILTLNLTFFTVAFLKVMVLPFTPGTLREVGTIALWGNLYLTFPWVIIFLLLGFYRRSWKFSFRNVLLGVTAGILILKSIDIAITLTSGDMSDLLPTSTGLKLILLYWCLLLFTLYTSRFLLTAFFDARARRSAGSDSDPDAGPDRERFSCMSDDYHLVAPPWHYLAIKRLVDFAGALCAFALFLPTLLLISLIIKITDPRGSVFFRQYRLGKNGRPFRIFKFRTMIHNAEAVLKKNRDLYEEYIRNNFKLPGNSDPRITWIGSFLRKTSLDELPQIFNALTGDMSLVGPRPIVLDEIVKYDKYRKKLLSVKPGITGWWQVSGRSNVDYPDRIYLEMFYVERASVFFDLKILIETIPVVLFGKGAH